MNANQNYNFASIFISHVLRVHWLLWLTRKLWISVSSLYTLCDILQASKQPYFSFKQCKRLLHKTNQSLRSLDAHRWFSSSCWSGTFSKSCLLIKTVLWPNYTCTHQPWHLKSLDEKRVWISFRSYIRAAFGPLEHFSPHYRRWNLEPAAFDRTRNEMVGCFDCKQNKL